MSPLPAKLLVLLHYPMSLEDDDGTGAFVIGVADNEAALIRKAESDEIEGVEGSGDETQTRVMREDGCPVRIEVDTNGAGDWQTYYVIQETDVIG